MAAVFKHEAHQLVDRLPDSATWDDLIECALFQKAVDEGVAAADRGEFASDKDVRRVFAKWTKDAGPEVDDDGAP